MMPESRSKVKFKSYYCYVGSMDGREVDGLERQDPVEEGIAERGLLLPVVTNLY
jgi:hypothetical protein